MIEQFVKQLLQEKGLPEDLDPEVHDRLIKDLTSRVEDLVNRRIIESLSDEQLASFEHLLDTDPENAEAMQKFVEENVQNKEQITTSALTEFRELYLGNN